MDALMLDGNAVAGLLQEVFAVEMTTALEACAGCGATEPDRRRPRVPGRRHRPSLPALQQHSRNPRERRFGHPNRVARRGDPERREICMTAGACAIAMRIGSRL